MTDHCTVLVDYFNLSKGRCQLLVFCGKISRRLFADRALPGFEQKEGRRKKEEGKTERQQTLSRLRADV